MNTTPKQVKEALKATLDYVELQWADAENRNVARLLGYLEGAVLIAIAELELIEKQTNN